MLAAQTIQFAAQRIAAAASSPAKVIVFGSYARGEAGEDSDLDLLVVEKEVSNHTRVTATCKDEKGHYAEVCRLGKIRAYKGFRPFVEQMLK